MLQNEPIVRRIIYVLLLVVAPGFLFMVQVVQFGPPILIFTYFPSVVWSHFSGEEAGSLVMVGGFAAHFLLLAGLYWLIAFALAKLVVFFRQPSTAGTFLVLILMGILGVSQLSLYGSGGHGASQIGPLQSLFFGPNAVSHKSLLLYLGSSALFLVIALTLSMLKQRFPSRQG